MLLQPYFGYRATRASNALSEIWKSDGRPSLEPGVPFGSNNTGINSRSLPLGLHKITPTVVFPWLDKFSFSELEGTSIQQRHPFLYLRSLLAALVPLDFPSDTDGGGGQQCLLSLGSDPMRLIFMLLSMFQTQAVSVFKKAKILLILLDVILACSGDAHLVHGVTLDTRSLIAQISLPNQHLRMVQVFASKEKQHREMSGPSTVPSSVQQRFKCSNQEENKVSMVFISQMSPSGLSQLPEKGTHSMRLVLATSDIPQDLVEGKVIVVR